MSRERENVLAASIPSTQIGASAPATVRSLPLERKLPLLNLALFGVVLAVSMSISYYEVRRSALLSASDRLIGLSRVLAAIVEQQTNARLSSMRRVAHDTAVQGALRA